MKTHRGYEVKFHNGRLIYCDNAQSVEGDHRATCGFCGLHDTPEGHDGCLGTLPNVEEACCGHGDNRQAYVRYDDGSYHEGEDTLKLMLKMRGQTNESQV